jgi:hypothetical protein
MDGQHDTREESSRWPGVLLEIYNIFHTISVQYTKYPYTLLFLIGEDDFC